MNKRAMKYNKAYLDLSLDADLIKAMKIALIEEFGNTRHLSLMVEHYLRDFYKDVDKGLLPYVMAEVRERAEAVNSKRVAAMNKGRERVASQSHVG